MDEIFNGCYGLGEESTDFLLTGENVDWLPQLKQQDTKIFEYNQGGTPHCTLYSAFGAVSDLFNYEFTAKEIEEMVDESYTRGRIRGQGWYVKNAVDLVADYWNENHSNLGKVIYYRVSLNDTELVDEILNKNYTLCSGYNGNKKYNTDRDDGILNGTTFGTSTYGHAVSWIGRNAKRYIKDNYKGRKNGNIPTNVYQVEHTPSQLVSGQCFFANAYVYLKVDNTEEVKRLNEFRTNILLAIETHSKMRHQTNSENYRVKLHNINEEHRKKLQDIEKELAKYQ